MKSFLQLYLSSPMCRCSLIHSSLFFKNQIGINPGLMAAFKGHHYAGPGNHFCELLGLDDNLHLFNHDGTYVCRCVCVRVCACIVILSVYLLCDDMLVKRVEKNMLVSFKNMCRKDRNKLLLNICLLAKLQTQVKQNVCSENTLQIWQGSSQPTLTGRSA